MKYMGLAGAGFESKGTYLFWHFSMQIKLVPGDSADTVTAYYVSRFIISFVVFFQKCCYLINFYVFIYFGVSSFLLKLQSTTRQTSNFWATGLGNHTFFRPMYSQEARVRESITYIFGSIPPRITIPMLCSGTCTRSCKPQTGTLYILSISYFKHTQKRMY